ncbi:P-loop containing nucleoside triphosphate hydrolase protein [Exidia glandulosa HHB12029]|uniref:DNA 3'-5' helicase n=1 Tax=Exidia glandulosa HHB12029 TaxID=1314781 RepID=A0A165C1B7_EXIGL|nr:P-loop containing nucleoside triphosphate hydrolase protein [Exidia glandulosa HHB12029]
MAPPHRRPRKAARPRTSASSRTTSTPNRAHVSDEDLERIGELMQNCFEWNHDAHVIQKEGGKAQARGKDVLVQAPTGIGKTGIVAAPHVFPEHKGRVTIFVSPLIALQEEMVTTFKDDYKLEAVAVNSTRRRSLTAIMEDICAGKYAVVLISPEMLLSRRFVDNVLRNKEFANRVLSVVVDEAHTVSHWGAQFRKKYGSLGIVRAFLPPNTSVVAMSATLTPRVRRDVLKKLQFGSDYLDLDEGNNRPNVSIVVRACHRTLSSFADLDFVVPDSIQAPEDIRSTFIYCDKKDDGDRIIDHLRARLPMFLQEEGLVRPFNATLSHRYRKEALQHFRAGNIRVLVCTDAAGMGCNVPNIEVVVQWKLPEKLSMFVQRAGRAARRSGTTGLAVLLVEPSAYNVVPTADIATQVAESVANIAAEKTKRKSRAPKGWAGQHGRSRGLKADADANSIDRDIKVHVVETDDDEGLAALYLTGDCRRRVLADAFGNTNKESTVPCCDLCDPSLLARTLPGHAIKSKRKPKKKKKDAAEPARDVIDALRDWRYKEWERCYRELGFTDEAILPEELIEDLASRPELASLDVLERVIGPWSLWSTYSEDVYCTLQGVYRARTPLVPPAPAAPRQPAQAPQSNKRNRTISEVQQESSPSVQHDVSTSRPQKRPKPSLPSRPEVQAQALAAFVAPLSPGQSVPRALRSQGSAIPPPSNASQGSVVTGSDGRWYFCLNGSWHYLAPSEDTVT